MKRLIAHVLAGFLVAAPLFAQVGASGSFNGKVVDQTGAFVPGATITVRNVDTGIGRITVTNDVGLYSVTALPPGRYEVKAELSGFAPEVRKDVELLVGATLPLDFVFKPAGVAEQVVVTGESPLVETSQSEIKGTIQRKEVENLPLLNRNFSGLVILMPGVRPAAAWDPTKVTIGGLSINGSRGRNLNTTVDGGDNKDNVVGGLLQNFTTEGIQEFKLAMHRFSAAEGRSSGASLTIVTKSGTNDFHGSAFLFARNQALTAKDFFAKRDNVEKSPFSRQQFGGSFGGPIAKNRAFFFGAIERIREDTSLTVSDPLFREMKLLEPFGAVASQKIPRRFRDTQYTIKGDVKLSDRHSVVLRWAQQRNRQLNNQVGINHDLSVPTFDDNKLYSLVASHEFVISPRALNQFTFQVNDFLNLIDSDKTPPATSNLTFPSVNIGRAGLAIMQTTTQRKLQFRDDFSMQAGRHSLRAGADYSRLLKYGGFFNFGAFGSFTFFDDPSVILSDRTRYPRGFQTPGIVSGFSQSTGLGDFRFLGAQQLATYFQDDWKLTDHLTLNLGVRYDLDIDFYSLRDLPNNRTFQILQRIGSPFAERLPKTDKNNVAPRVGFAYDPAGNGRTVVRGGYGIFYDDSFINPLFPVVSQAKRQLFATITRVNTAPGVGELDTFRFGVDPPPPPPGPVLDLPRGGRSTGQWQDPHYVDPSNQQWSIGLSRQLSRTLVLDVDYTHILGSHEFRILDINPIKGGRRVLAPQLGAALGDPNILGAVLIKQSTNRSRYDELAVRLQQRFSRAVTFQASYTLSKAAAFGGLPADNNITAQDQDNLFSPDEWGPSPQDERHRVVFFGIFELPFGLQLSPVVQAATARPYNLLAGVDLNGDGRNNDRYVDPATGRQVSVNSQRGDRFFLTDLRVTKIVTLTTSLARTSRLAVFVEFFNLFNTVNFGNNYNGNARSRQFKQPVGFIGGAGNPFQMQVGGRFSF